MSRSASSTPPPPQENLNSSNHRPTRIPASYRSLPRSYKLDSVSPSHHSSSSDSLEEAASSRSRRPLSMSVDTWRASTLPGHYRRPPSPGEYVSIHYRAKPEKMSRTSDSNQAEYIAMDTHSYNHVPNGEYTQMAFEPETLLSHVKKVGRPEKRPTTESLEGKLSKSAVEKNPWMLPIVEKNSTEESYWLASTNEKTFQPIDPTDIYNANVTVPGESTTDHVEKMVVARSSSEDMGLKGLLTAVSGCNIYN
ncbi:unnamed protein product, partial [Ranitomeya imitator]